MLPAVVLRRRCADAAEAAWHAHTVTPRAACTATAPRAAVRLACHIERLQSVYALATHPHAPPFPHDAAFYRPWSPPACSLAWIPPSWVASPVCRDAPAFRQYCHTCAGPRLPLTFLRRAREQSVCTTRACGWTLHLWVEGHQAQEEEVDDLRHASKGADHLRGARRV